MVENGKEARRVKKNRAEKMEGEGLEVGKTIFGMWGLKFDHTLEGLRRGLEFFGGELSAISGELGLVENK